jgi:hypothetical protein
MAENPCRIELQDPFDEVLAQKSAHEMARKLVWA